MAYAQDDYLQLSGIQHFAFCRRQWALIHIEQLWDDNLRTVEGNILHANAHDPFFREKRGNVITTREMPIFSASMGVSGQCDIVEFYRDDANGVPLQGQAGKWRPCPVEYKRGRPKATEIDELQLCAQAMCLEEMLACHPIEQAYLYYGETRRREQVELSKQLRAQVKAMFVEMHAYYSRGYTPRSKRTKSCNACSLNNLCLPGLPESQGSVSKYILQRIQLEELV